MDVHTFAWGLVVDVHTFVCMCGPALVSQVRPTHERGRGLTLALTLPLLGWGLALETRPVYGVLQCVRASGLPYYVSMYFLFQVTCVLPIHITNLDTLKTQKVS